MWCFFLAFCFLCFDLGLLQTTTDAVRCLPKISGVYRWIHAYIIRNISKFVKKPTCWKIRMNVQHITTTVYILFLHRFVHKICLSLNRSSHDEMCLDVLGCAATSVQKGMSTSKHRLCISTWCMPIKCTLQSIFRFFGGTASLLKQCI